MARYWPWLAGRLISRPLGGERSTESAPVKRIFLLLLLASTLFVLGFFAPSPLLALTEALLHRPVIAVSAEEPITFALSISLLFACTVPAAALLYWACARRRALKSASLMFALCLATSASAGFAAIVVRVLVLARLLSDFVALPSGAAIRPQALGFLQWGLSGMLLVCGAIVLVLELLPRPDPPGTM